MQPTDNTTQGKRLEVFSFLFPIPLFPFACVYGLHSLLVSLVVVFHVLPQTLLFVHHSHALLAPYHVFLVLDASFPFQQLVEGN